MIRGILAVIVGYIVLTIVLMAALTGGYLAVKADGAFQPAPSWEVTNTWLGIWFAGNLVAGLIAGAVAGKVAAGPGGVKAFATIALLLGLAGAAAPLVIEMDRGPRPADTPLVEAAQKAEQPMWAAFATPFLVFVCISIGGRGAKKKV